MTQKRDKIGRQIVRNRSARPDNSRTVPSDAESVPVAEAACLLGVSPRSVKRMCVARQLQAFRTAGGHWRISRASIEATKKGADVVFRAQVAAPASAGLVAAKREGVEALRAELDERRLKRELSRFDTEDAKAERERAEVLRAQKLAAKARLAEIHQQRERDAREQERDRARQQRAQWRRGWINGAINGFPDWCSSEQHQALLSAVDAELNNWDVGDSDEAIGEALCRTIERVTVPWRAEREEMARRERLIEYAAFNSLFGVRR